VPGVNKLQKYINGGFQSALPYWSEQGKKVGIQFSYGGNVGNTLDSHRLIEFAKKYGKQDEMVEKIMSYYFEKEQDISEKKTLIKAAKEVGLDAKEYLEGNENVERVKNEISEAHLKGVSGVPAFIVNGKYLISGARETEDWVDMLENLGYKPQ